MATRVAGSDRIGIEAPFHPYRGAVSLTFDDGTANQLERAVPPLDERQQRATFYVCPGGDDWEERLAPWRAVDASGHEIGNHSLSHPCPDQLFEAPGGLERMSIQDMERDIAAAQERLVQIAPHQDLWTFAYPCYATFVGRGGCRQSYVPLVAQHFLAGRAAGEYGFANDPALVDLACFAALPVERMSGFEMIGLVEQLAFQGGWVVLVFHEIDGSRLTVGSYDYHMLLDYLKRKDEAGEIWTAPVVDVAARIDQFQSTLSSR